MSEESIRSLLDFAVEIAWAAGALTLRYFQTGIGFETKADRSPVTVADREAEQLCRERIEQVHPADGIVGEEYGIVRSQARRRWILDPIDGTRSFLRGVPLYGVLIALEEGEDAIVGVLHFPALKETVWAGRGEGCWWNGQRARVSPVDRLEEAAVLTTDAERLRPAAAGGRDAATGPAPAGGAGDGAARDSMAAGYERLRARAGLVRTWGDCYGHALVATGRAEVMLDPIAAVWDAAALRPVVEEAGGLFTDWSGGRTHRGGSAVSTNAALAGTTRRLLAGTLPGLPQGDPLDH